MSLPALVDRDQYLAELVQGRRVIHVGCGAEGATELQFKKGRLLFALLERSSAGQLGVDPDTESMKILGQLVKPRWPLQSCYLGELPQKLLDEFQPELILLPETIEHVTNPGSLLSESATLAKRYNSTVVVTVPNALAISAITNWLGGFESIHPDHVATYTPRSLQTLLEKVGFRTFEIRPYTWGIAARMGFFKRFRKVVFGDGPMVKRVLEANQNNYAYLFPDGWIASSKPE